VRLLIDAQLPPALARLLVERGHQAEHVTEIGRADMSDRELWAFALDHSAVIVTKDEDFAQMVTLAYHSPVIVWVRVGNTRRRALLEWFEPLIEQVASMVESGQRLIELR